MQIRSYADGFTHCKVFRDMETRLETKPLYGNSASNSLGSVNGSKLGDTASPSHDRLIYIMTHLIGRYVEVQVKNGSVISGIFHSTHANRDLEIVLKMAVVVKNGSTEWPNSLVDTLRKPRTMIIPAKEFVQLVAQDVVLSHDRQESGNHKDLMIDSVISRSHHVEAERKLEPWMPDEDDSEYPDLDNISDGTWNRHWDQFQTNEVLFGVKSTFDEELYTTKLERGPHMRELEQQALRIALEIEGEVTEDPHLAEERGIYLSQDYDLDEESRYSAVTRDVDGRLIDDGDSYYPSETFGECLDTTSQQYLDTSSKAVNDEAQLSSSELSLDDDPYLGIISDKGVYLPYSIDDCNSVENCLSPVNDKSRLSVSLINDHERGKIFLKESKESTASQESLASKIGDIHTSTKLKGLSPSATAYVRSPSVQVHRSVQYNGSTIPSKLLSAQANVYVQASSSTSSTLEQVGRLAVPGASLTPSSSFGSLSPEKSMLNPNAKEFKLNPNARSFIPTASSRSHQPFSDGALYYTNNVIHPHLHGVSVAMGVDSSPSHQPVFYRPQGAWQSPQAYIHANGSLHGQQMMVGSGQPLYYSSTYQPVFGFSGNAMERDNH